MNLSQPVRADGADAGAVTQWLAELGQDPAAAQQVYSALYQPLKRLARSHMRRENPNHTLSATALVHEAWLRLSDQSRTQWRDRGHFMAIASTMMRRILVDHALARRAAKRDASFDTASTSALEQQPTPLDRDVVAVHDALLALEAHDPRAAKVVELRFFGGFELEEVAEALGVSLATVKRDWTLARAWLRREMGGSSLPG
jgi:RNA polymerase sigma factor (TIGR02999 family)